MTADDVRRILSDVGLCGEHNGRSVCILHGGHHGKHGFETDSVTTSIPHDMTWKRRPDERGRE